MKRALFLLALVGGALMLLHAIFFSYNDANLEVSNNTPYTIKYAYSYTSKKGERHVKGWFEIQSGETALHEERTKDDEVKFSITAITLLEEADLLRWVYDIGEESPISMEFTNPESEENLLLEVHEENFNYKVVSNEIQEGSDVRTFASVPMGEGGNSQFIFQDPDMVSLFYDPYSASAQKDLESRLRLAPELRLSLHRQMWFDRQFPNPDVDYPFLLAFLEDDNGYHTKGVKVSKLFQSKTIKGGNFPLLPGDYIIGVENPVYSGADLYTQLYAHGTSLHKGIEEPIKLDIIREGKLYTVECTYFFNESFYGFSDDNDGEAAGYGFLNSIFYGNGPAGITISKQILVTIGNLFSKKKKKLPNYKRTKWVETQKEYRLRQMKPDAFNGGSFIGIWTSPGQLLTKSTAKVVAKAGFSRASSRVIAAAIIETAEGGLYSYNDAPVLATSKEQMEAAVKSMPESFGIGVLIGTVMSI
ncbi:hypothetical protein [Flagellimonas sp. 2504JD4-2]